MGEGMGESILPGPQARIASFFLTKLDKEGLIHQGLIAFAINGATDLSLIHI